MELFSIRCETCGTGLKVRDLAAIGQILSCPKCESMVQVVPPPGWKPPAETAPEPKKESAPPAESAPPENPAPAAVDDALDVPAEPAGSDQWQQPFGFEEPKAANWKKLATVGMLATSAVLFGVMIWLATSNGSPEVAQQDPEKKTEQPQSDPESKSVDEPKKKTDIEKKALPTDPPDDPQPADPEPKPPALVPKAVPKIEIDPATGRPYAPGAAPKKPDPKVAEPKKVDPEPPKVDPKPPVVEPKPPVDPPVADPRLTNPLLPNPNTEPTQTTEVVEIRKDVSDRLADPIPSIDIRNRPLVTVIEELSRFSTLEITLDLDSLSAIGVTPEDKVSVSLTDTNVGQLLQRLLEQLNLVYVVESGQLRVISKQAQAQQRRTARYPVAKLAPDEAASAQLVQAIQTLIAPSSWTAAPDADPESAPAIALAAGTLTVTHGEQVHRELERFLSRLSVARGLTAVPPADADTALATRYDLVADRLAKKLTVNYSELPLERVLAELERRSELVILVDGLALGQVGLSPDVRATVRTKEPQPLFLIMDRLLSPLEIAYRIIDAKTLQVTNRQVAANLYEIEFHRIKDLVTNDAAAQELIAKLKRDVLPDSWERKADRPAIVFDSKARCLIVSHNQYAQVMVQGYLDTLRAPTEVREAGKAE